MKWLFMMAGLIVTSIHSAHATDLSCVSTTFNALSPNDKVCVSAFDDPKVPGIVCHISQARKGGWGQPFGLNEDPSNFSVSCRQNGPIDVDLSKLGDNEEVFSQKTSIFFKRLVFIAWWINPGTRSSTSLSALRSSMAHRRMRSAPFRSCRGQRDSHSRRLFASRRIAILRRGAFFMNICFRTTGFSGRNQYLVCTL